MPPVPFPAADLNNTAVTPFRKTHVVFGLPEYRKIRESVNVEHRGRTMTDDAGQPSGRNLNVTLLPSESWCISSWEMQGQFQRSAATGNAIPGTGSDPGTDLSLAPGFATFASYGPIPGVSYDPAFNNPSQFARKRRAASDDWHAELSSDMSSYPPPLYPSMSAPMRRVAYAANAYGQNQPLYLRFMGPGAPLQMGDVFLTWYLGGDVTTVWKDTAVTIPGGQFCMSLYGNGTMLLFERTKQVFPGTTFDSAHPWRLVEVIQWEIPGRIANRQHVIMVIPEGRDTLNILGSDWQHVFIGDSTHCGYSYKQAMTGAGGMRLDMREDLRLPFQFGRQTFPTGGSGDTSTGAVLYGIPFKVPYRMATGTNIDVILDQLNAPGGAARSVVPALFSAKDNSQLTGTMTGSGGTFPTVDPAQRSYYARYAFQSPDNQYTPFLRGAEFRVDGAVQLFTPTPYEGGQVMEVAITGPDAEMDCDHASVLIEDDQGILTDGPEGLGGLDQHADIHVQIQTQWHATDPTKKWVLFDGTLVRAPGAQVGKDWGGGDTQYPSKWWRTYRVELAGPWYRLNQDWMRVWSGRNFTRDPAGPADVTSGQNQPYQVIDVIKELLKDAGYDDSQLTGVLNPNGLATGGPRLFASWKDPQNGIIMPGRPVTEEIQRLLKDYLGARLIWDKEALPHGRWLTVYPPALTGTYPSLWTFRASTPPAAPLMAVHLPGVWPTGTTFVTQYTTWVTPPEANFFAVGCMAGNPAPVHDPQKSPGRNTGPVKDKPTLCMAVGVNWRSTDFEGYAENGFAGDPESLDWVPYGVKPYIDIDPHLAVDGNIEKSNEACRYVCRMKMNAAAYGLRWFQWLAPLVAYFDPNTVYGGGPRTFRPYDIVDFNDGGTVYPVVLTCCNPQIGLPEGDLFQQAEYVGYVPPEPLSY